MWTYDQASGNLDRDGEPVGVGYSGAGEGRNNPDDQDIQNVGPIPRGAYSIGAPYDTATHGPFVMRLTPSKPLEDGRGGYLIHGDNATHTASEGCIILTRLIREAIWKSGDHDLTVV